MKITSSEYTVTAVYPEQYPKDMLKEICLLGRSNVGKSSFINSLTNKKNLAYTSQTPGKTQTLNFFKINNSFYFVDVPGYGYAKRSKAQIAEFGKIIETYLTTRKNLINVFMIVDIRHKVSEDDKLMYNYLKYYHLPVTVIATKVDKIGKTLVKKHLDQVKTSLNFDTRDKIFTYSSFTKSGVNEVLEYLDSILTHN